MKSKHFKPSLVVAFIALLCFVMKASWAETGSVFMSSSRLTSNDSGVLTSSMTDHAATITRLKGEVQFRQKEEDDWVPAEENQTIREGNMLKTASASTVDVVYDDSALNVAHIDENTVATFRAIEPTELHLVNGSIYNLLKGMNTDESYNVSTPVSIVAVRGTEFVRTYNEIDRTDSTTVSDGAVASFPILPDGSKSAESITVTKDSALSLTPDIIRSKPIAQIRPRPLEESERGRLKNFSQSVRAHLEQIAGGPEALKQRQTRAQEMMNDPEFRQKFHEEKMKMNVNRPQKGEIPQEHKPLKRDKPGNPDGNIRPQKPERSDQVQSNAPQKPKRIGPPPSARPSHAKDN